MAVGLIAKKIGMTQLYDAEGALVGATVLAAGPCVVVQRKDVSPDGYDALQLGLAESRPAKRVTKPRQGHFKKAGVADIVTLVLGNAHEKVKDQAGPIDILFLDADKKGYIDYLEKLLPKVRPGGLVVAHNIDPRMADPRYVKAITTSKELDTLLVNLRASGISDEEVGGQG